MVIFFISLFVKGGRELEIEVRILKIIGEDSGIEGRVVKSVRRAL